MAGRPLVQYSRLSRVGQEDASLGLLALRCSKEVALTQTRRKEKHMGSVKSRTDSRVVLCTVVKEMSSQATTF